MRDYYLDPPDPNCGCENCKEEKGDCLGHPEDETIYLQEEEE
jgi:hypothetical protein